MMNAGLRSKDCSDECRAKEQGLQLLPHLLELRTKNSVPCTVHVGITTTYHGAHPGGYSPHLTRAKPNQVGLTVQASQGHANTELPRQLKGDMHE